MNLQSDFLRANLLQPAVFAMEAWEVKSYLQDSLGWTYLNAAAAEVYISPDRKMVARVDSHADHGFMMYADICKRLNGNPYLQKVYDEFVLPQGLYIAVLERLIRVPPKLENHRTKAVCTFKKVLTAASEKTDVADNFLKDTAFREAACALFTCIDNYYGKDFSPAPYFDMPGGNIMARIVKGQGLHPVLMDPFTAENNLRQKDLPHQISPWHINIRRKVGMMDPPYFRYLPPSYDNTWILR